MFVSLSHGYGKRSTTLTDGQHKQVVKAEVIGQAFAIAAFPTGKASVAICLMRIFPGRALRWSLGAIVAANTIVFYLDAILILVQCNPVHKQWDHNAPGVCWDPSIITDYGIFTGGMLTVTRWYIRTDSRQLSDALAISSWLPFRGSTLLGYASAAAKRSASALPLVSVFSPVVSPSSRSTTLPASTRVAITTTTQFRSSFGPALSSAPSTSQRASRRCGRCCRRSLQAKFTRAIGASPTTSRCTNSRRMAATLMIQTASTCRLEPLVCNLRTGRF